MLLLLLYNLILLPSCPGLRCLTALGFGLLLSGLVLLWMSYPICPRSSVCSTALGGLLSSCRKAHSNSGATLRHIYRLGSGTRYKILAKFLSGGRNASVPSCGHTTTPPLVEGTTRH